MPIENPTPENNQTDNLPVFEFKTEPLLLPEHVEPADDFIAFGSSDDDLQF